MDCCNRLRDLERAEELEQKHCTCTRRGDEYKSGLWGYSAKMDAPMSRKAVHAAVRAYRDNTGLESKRLEVSFRVGL